MPGRMYSGAWLSGRMFSAGRRKQPARPTAAAVAPPTLKKFRRPRMLFSGTWMAGSSTASRARREGSTFSVSVRQIGA